MRDRFTELAQGLKVAVLSFMLCTTTGCSAFGNDVKTGFVWGPITDETLASTGTIDPQAGFAPESHAAQLREELLAPVNRYAPSDKDWRFVRGADKGPTIFGARLTIGFGEQGHTELRLGAVRRGANRTFGPQFIFNFGQ